MAEVEQKRISQLTAMPDSDREVISVDDLINSRTEAGKWSFAIDYTKPAGAGPTDRDDGSRRIPVSRVALLTKTGIVPARMLPNRVDGVKTGTMTVTGTGANTKWTFVYTEDSQTHTCVCPGPAGAGEEMPSIDYIYAHSAGDDYQQYRYVPDDGSNPETGNFVPIPSDLMVKDGDGIVVVDDTGTDTYTRQFDINIGNPANPSQSPKRGSQTSILQVQSADGALVHTNSGVNAGAYPTYPQPGQGVPTRNPDFGETFIVPQFTVNSTGHVTGVVVNGDAIVTVPSTAATRTDASTVKAGLVKIGTSSTSIAQNSSGGSSSPAADGYFRVAAADHKHSASTLTLSNNGTGSNVTYNGDKSILPNPNKEYDFRYVLRTVLPSAGPSAADQILVSEAVSGGSGIGQYKAVWKDHTTVIKPEYAFFSVGGTVGGTLTVSNVTKSDNMAVSVSSGTITVSGLLAGKTYVLSYGLAPQAGSPSVNLVPFTVNFGTSSAKHVLDESVTGIPNYVNGTVMFNASATSATITLAREGSVTWTLAAGSTMQVAEVK